MPGAIELWERVRAQHKTELNQRDTLRKWIFNRGRVFSKPISVIVNNGLSIYSLTTGKLELPSRQVVTNENCTLRFTEVRLFKTSTSNPGRNYKLAHLSNCKGKLLANFELTFEGSELKLKPIIAWPCDRAEIEERLETLERWKNGTGSVPAEIACLIEPDGTIKLGDKVETSMTFAGLGARKREAFVWFKWVDGVKSAVVYEADNDTILQEIKLNKEPVLVVRHVDIERRPRSDQKESEILETLAILEAKIESGEIDGPINKRELCRSTYLGINIRMLQRLEQQSELLRNKIIAILKQAIDKKSSRLKIRKHSHLSQAERLNAYRAAYTTLAKDRDLGREPISPDELAEHCGYIKGQGLSDLPDFIEPKMVLSIKNDLGMRMRRVQWALDRARNGISESGEPKYRNLSDFCDRRLKIGIDAWYKWVRIDSSIAGLLSGYDDIFMNK